MNKHERRRDGEKKFSVQSNLRHYVYSAFVSEATGRLLRVTAGCRKWKTFEEAKRHYRGEALNRPEYHSDYIYGGLRSVAENYGCNFGGWGQTYLSLYAQRAEARSILNNLSSKVRLYQSRQRKKAKRK